MPRSTVLLIEDDASTRYIHRRALESAGYKVMAASDGSFGLDYLQAQASECCLVLLDLKTPYVNGWKFLFRCQSDPELRSLPIIVITGALTPGERMLGSQPRAILYKPVTTEMLLATVAEHCSPSGSTPAPQKQ